MDDSVKAQLQRGSERILMHLIVRNYSIRDIAEYYGSNRTKIQKRINALYRAYGARNRSQLIVRAHKASLIDIDRIAEDSPPAKYEEWDHYDPEKFLSCVKTLHLIADI